MLKVFLKHTLYEYCIDLIFDLVAKNFTQPKFEGIELGHKFKCITAKDYRSGLLFNMYDVELVDCNRGLHDGEIVETFMFYSICGNRDVYQILQRDVVSFTRY